MNFSGLKVVACWFQIRYCDGIHQNAENLVNWLLLSSTETLPETPYEPPIIAKFDPIHLETSDHVWFTLMDPVTFVR